MKDKDPALDVSVSLYGLTSSNVRPLEKVLPQNFWRGARKERITMLEEAMSTLSEPLKGNAETAFEVSLGRAETQKCFATTKSYCCDTSKAKHMSAARHDAVRKHLCVRCYSPYENMVMGRGSSSRMVAEKIEMRRRVKELQTKVGKLAGRPYCRRRQGIKDEEALLLS